MADERSWGADTVALGRKAGGEASQPERRPKSRAARPSLRPPTRPALALGAFAIVALAAWLVSGGGGSGSSKAPIREVADPAPRVVVKPPTRMRRREPRQVASPDVHRRAAGPLEGKREPKASAAPHELDAPESAPEPVIEPAPEPIPAPAPEAPPPTPAPTSSAAEFGM